MQAQNRFIVLVGIPVPEYGVTLRTFDYYADTLITRRFPELPWLELGFRPKGTVLEIVGRLGPADTQVRCARWSEDRSNPEIIDVDGDRVQVGFLADDRSFAVYHGRRAALLVHLFRVTLGDEYSLAFANVVSQWTRHDWHA